MDIIVPACGQSTRFPGTRPKFLLATYNGKFMLEKAIEPFLYQHDIHVVVLREHVEKYNFIQVINQRINKHPVIDWVVLDSPTKGPADTVYQAIKKIGLDKEPIFIRDCDSFFDTGDLEPGNFIYTDNIANQTKSMAEKSFVVVNSQDIVSSIMEKHIVSNFFCVGGYQFGSAFHFTSTFEQMVSTKEPYVSDIIQRLLDGGSIFISKPAKDYVDVGTLTDWLEYNDRPTIFCDVDGVVLYNQSSLTGFQNPKALVNNVETLKKHRAKGCMIIFTTARGSDIYFNTRDALDDLGFHDCRLIMGINRGKRIVINDFQPANPYPSAVAINIKSDEDHLDILFPCKN